MNKERNSNFELLRIVAMMLIILHHLFVNCISGLFAEINASAPAQLINNQEFYGKIILMDYAFSLGKIGNLLFIMISGYFLIDKESVNLAGRIKKILSQVLFITLTLTIGSFGLLFVKNIRTTITVFSFQEEWWFIGFYIAIVIIGEIGLNRFAGKLDSKKYLALLAMLFCICVLSFTRTVIRGIAVGLEVLTAGVLAYLIGGYIKRFRPFEKLHSVAIWGIILFSVIIMGLLHYNYTYNGIRTVISAGEEIYKPEFVPYAEYYLPCIVLSTMIFELVQRKKLKSNRIISFIAASTFMMYLIHSNGFAVNLLYYLDWYNLLRANDNKKIWFYIVCVVVGVMITSVMLYALYLAVVKLFGKLSGTKKQS